MDIYRLSSSSEEKLKANMGDFIINYMANDSVNKIESQILNGVDNSKNEKIIELVENSDFITKRQKAGKILSLSGEVFCVLLYINNKWYIEFLKPIWYTYYTSSREIQSITAESFDQSLRSDIKESKDLIYFKFEILNYKNKITKKNEKRVQKLKFTNAKLHSQGEIKSDKKADKFKYPKNIDFIPGAIIRNNPISTPDWKNAEDILEELNYFSNKLVEEWRKIKTQYNFNNSYSGKGDMEKLKENMIDRDKSFHESRSSNSRFGNPISVMISGSPVIDTLLLIINFLEDKAMKYAQQGGRDMEGSRTNKHNMQVGLFNQSHSENNYVKIGQRNRDFTYFFKNIVSKALNINKENLEKIFFSNSPFEKGKQDNMEILESQKKLNDAQAIAMKAAAAKNKEETRLMEEKMLEDKKAKIESENNKNKIDKIK